MNTRRSSFLPASLVGWAWSGVFMLSLRAGADILALNGTSNLFEVSFSDTPLPEAVVEFADALSSNTHRTVTVTAFLPTNVTVSAHLRSSELADAFVAVFSGQADVLLRTDPKPYLWVCLIPKVDPNDLSHFVFCPTGTCLRRNAEICLSVTNASLAQTLAAIAYKANVNIAVPRRDLGAGIFTVDITTSSWISVLQSILTRSGLVMYEFPRIDSYLITKPLHCSGCELTSKGTAFTHVWAYTAKGRLAAAIHGPGVVGERKEPDE